MKKFFIFIIAIFLTPTSWAKKVRYIQDLVKTLCKTEISVEFAMLQVKPLYLDCNGYQKVQIDLESASSKQVTKTCSIICLKGETPFEYSDIAKRNDEFFIFKEVGNFILPVKQKQKDTGGTK